MSTADRFRLRTFLDGLDADELHRVTQHTDLVDVAKTVDATTKAVLLESVGSGRDQIAANVAGSRGRLARAFETESGKLLPEVLRRLEKPGEVNEEQREDALLCSRSFCRVTTSTCWSCRSICSIAWMEACSSPPRWM